MPLARSRIATESVDEAVGRLATERRRLVLAVSGGVDSMVLLESAARMLGDRIAVVATFDHRTGPAAVTSVRHVRRRARELGLSVETATARARVHSEAAWRAARWGFLHAVARRHHAVVVTAHTRDDRIETLVIRALRGAGARGLAAMYPRPGVRWPLLGVSRHTIHEYAREKGIRWIEDPSNDSLAFRRNRVRHELLPAMRRVHPDIDDALLTIAERASAWRRDVDHLGAGMSMLEGSGAHRRVRVALADLHGYDRESLATVWPAIAARAGATLDRRGTERLAGFTTTAVAGRRGGRIQLAGGWEVVRLRDALLLRRAADAVAEESELPLAGALRWGRWSFFPQRSATSAADDAWSAALPVNVPLRVRAWMPGDRMRGTDGRPRRVKRFLRDAGIAGVERTGWPVVMAGEEIVWIPGVRRSDAATERSGRPGLFCYCEFDDWRTAGR